MPLLMNNPISNITTFHQELKGGRMKDLVISKIAPYEGLFYFPLTIELRIPMKGLVNIQKKDSECFR